MKELLVLHQKEGKTVNRFRVRDNSDIFTIGSGRRSNIRILGDEIDSLHACFEKRDGIWKVIDLGSESGTWVNNSPIVEHSLEEPLLLRIGKHTLEVRAVELKSLNIFKIPKKVDIKGEEQKIYQQIVVLMGDAVMESYLEEPGKVIKVPYARKVHEVQPAKGPEWQEQSFGSYKIKNRLVRSPQFKREESSIWAIFPEDLIKPTIWAVSSTFVFLLACFIIPKALKGDPGAIKENQYTKLIFDEKEIKKQKKKALKLTKKIEKKIEKPKKVAKKKVVAPRKKAAPKVLAPRKKKIARLAPSRSNKKVNAKAAKVVSSIKKAGLSRLVSKVALRSSNNALLVKTKGVKANKGTGRGFASISNLKSGAKLGSASATGSFRVGGINTKGTAGGGSVSGSLGSLSGSGVGTGVVDALEEETEIAGGLSAEEIAAVVKKNIGAVRYCYERQLAANPDLYGKIKVEFVISPAGRVSTQKIKSTTMKSSLVEGCILRKIKRWKFPIPKGGTEVAVSYPFYFKSNK